MAFLSALFVVLNVLASAVSANYVFAHVVVGNTAAHTQDTWTNDILLAQSSGIDAFALNVAYPDGNIPGQIANAFAAADAVGSGFKLFFSFDYPGGGQPWPATGDTAPFSVAYYLNTYKTSPHYFLYNGVPFVSTFEGIGNTGDWAPGGVIRNAVGSVYFVPDWTSLGTGGIGANLANIDGFFNWDMWPNGATNKTDDVDKAWKAAIGAKTFMMGVSPWFFHSALGGQDWVWRGDDLWADRWAQTLDVQPDFVEIVTWNDFGEAHYIGPISSDSEIPAGSAQFVDGFPHDAWRKFLPYYIAAYKGTPLAITTDQVQYWYRETPAASGSACGVTGNIASQGQTEANPNSIMEDGIFFSALLVAAGDVTVQIGSSAAETFTGAAGINHWSIPFAGRTGAPTFTVVRNGATTAQGTGLKEIADGTGECTNYNAFVGGF